MAVLESLNEELEAPLDVETTEEERAALRKQKRAEQNARAHEKLLGIL